MEFKWGPGPARPHKVWTLTIAGKHGPKEAKAKLGGAWVDSIKPLSGIEWSHTTISHTEKAWEDSLERHNSTYTATIVEFEDAKAEKQIAAPF